MLFDEATKIFKNGLLKFTKIWLQKSKNDMHLLLKTFCAAMILPSKVRTVVSPFKNHALLIEIPKSHY